MRTLEPATTQQPATPEPSPRLQRYNRYAGAVILTILAALVFSVLQGDGSETATGRLGGDYPSFYGAGSIVLDGDIADLYAPERQALAQEGLLDDGEFLFFAYPPPVAAAYAPLAALPYRVSFLVHTLLMVAALVASVWLLRPMVREIDRAPLIATAIALTFYPMFRAITGGQNTALTALLVAGALRCEHDDRPALAGLVAAGLLYKPQFGIPVAVLLLVARRGDVLKGWVGGAAAFVVAGALLSGPTWIGDWWREATRFAEQNEGVNGFLFVSIPGMIANVVGTQSGAARTAWLAAAAFVATLLVYVWWRFDDPLTRWGVGSLGLVLLLPQALFYEVGLALLALVAVGASGFVFAMLWVVSWSQLAADALGWSPLGLVAAVTMAWVLWQIVSRDVRVERVRK